MFLCPKIVTVQCSMNDIDMTMDVGFVDNCRCLFAAILAQGDIAVSLLSAKLVTTK